MISTKFLRILHGLSCGSALCIAFSLAAAAQVKTQTEVKHGPATRTVKVERGEIVYISGNNVVIKMEDGTLRHFDNVPDSVTFMVDGKPVNIHNAKVGMKLEKQTITTTTPKVITTVKTVTGAVWHVVPPLSVTLRLEDGNLQSFKIPKGQKFTIDGKETDAFGLRKGMKISAKAVTEEPVSVVSQEVARTGTLPAPPPEPLQEGVPILVLVLTAKPAPPAMSASAEPAPTKLPKTASELPLVGLLGAFFCSFGFALVGARAIYARLWGSRS